MDEKVKAKKKAKKTNTIDNSKNITNKDDSMKDDRLKCEIEPKVTIKLCDIGSADVETGRDPMSFGKQNYLGKQIYKVRLEVYGESAEHIVNQMQRYYKYIKEKENRVKVKP